ncbi:AAA family ATPase [Shewanella algae]|uniref:AAA family ATPase n=1 Tax=Shewanella algae TaxID=38313 RepID=UPI001AACA8CC|nr:AAA family ATPase [Shewanella algae]
MRIKNIIAKNYKGFKDLNCKLAKVNIIIGKNGSGKSTITRLLPLIIDSMILDSNDVINLYPRDIDIGGVFSDITHGGSEASKVGLGLVIENNGKKYKFVTTIIYSTELRRIIVFSFDFSVIDGPVEKKMYIELGGYQDRNPYYLVNSKESEVRFCGLLPMPFSINKDIEYLSELQDFFKIALSLQRSVSYLGPFRDFMKRVYPIKFGLSANLGKNGEFAPYVMYQDFISDRKNLMRSMKEWMKKIGSSQISVDWK